MKRKLLLALGIFLSATATAQYNLGIGTSNWGGLQSLYLNPANIADSREKFTIEIFSANGGIDNSLGTIKNSGGLLGVINDGNTNDLFNYNRNEKFSMLAPYVNVHLPGIAVSINHRHSVALTTGIRGFNQFNNFDRSLYKTLTDTSYAPDGNLDLTSNRFNYTAHVWSEVGFSYAGVLVDQEMHELKVGVTLRYLGGIGYLGLKGNNMDAHYKSANDTLFVNQTDLEFASNIISTRSALLNGVSNHNILEDFFGSKEGSGFGADIGVVYDYMPAGKATEVTKDGKKVKIDNTKNRYLLRISASVMDLGAITYKSATNSNAKITGDGYIAGSDFSQHVSSYDEFKNYVVAHGFTADTSHRDTKVYMPTTLRLGVDYHIYKAFYVNGTYIANLANRQNFGNSYYNQLTITPRFDTRLFSVGMPVTYSALPNNVKIGLGLRLSGFYIGSDDMLGLFSSNQTGFNVFAGGFVQINKHGSRTMRRSTSHTNTEDEQEPDMEHGGSADSSDAFVVPRRQLMPAEETGTAFTSNQPGTNPAYHREYMKLEMDKR